LFVALTLLAGCGGSSGPNAPSATAALSARNLNLIFVVSEDLAYQGPGDLNQTTANLTDQGLQRSLMMATFLRRHVLGKKNVTAVYALEPMTHLQTANKYPDMAAYGTIQQFALLNQVTLTAEGVTYTANSYPINVSYGSAVPTGVATPAVACPNCGGLDFADQGGDNETLVDGMIKANVPGFYVFSAPWETTATLLAHINTHGDYNLNLPTSFAGPNYVYAITIAPSGKARLVTFNSHLKPASTYPVLPPPALVSAECDAQAHFNITVTVGSGGAVKPNAINTNETVYMVRHAEAHPVSTFEDGNYVCAGQWRALDLPNALRGTIAPNLVYSIDPAQATPGGQTASGNSTWSYVRPSLTVEPYAIANGLPYGLAASFELIAQNPPQLATVASSFFFTGGQFTNQTVLLAWEHDHIPPTVNALIASYFPGGVGPAPAPGWPDDDYDTIWTVTLDANGNMSVSNSLCEGIQSATLPATCPQF
jgi:hypothetical protein